MRRTTPHDPPDTLGVFASLGYPDYCLLWGATACGQAAAWALVVLRAALVYELTRSNAWVGFVTMAAQLPSLVVTPFAGLLADRFDRRRVLAGTFTLNLLNNLLLALLVLSGQITPGALLGIALVNGILRATEMPTTQALLPNLVPGPYLLNAVALHQLMQQGSRMMGPLFVAPPAPCPGSPARLPAVRRPLRGRLELRGADPDGLPRGGGVAGDPDEPGRGDTLYLYPAVIVRPDGDHGHALCPHHGV